MRLAAFTRFQGACCIRSLGTRFRVSAAWTPANRLSRTERGCANHSDAGRPLRRRFRRGWGAGRRPTSMETASVQYPEGLPQALKTSDEAFQRELGFLAAAKLFELGRISSGVAAQIAGVSRVEFLRR